MGIAATLARLAGRLAQPLIRRQMTLPSDLLARHPELARARWRRGGLPVRVGGWCLGQSSVSAITLWRTIWVAPGITPSLELLLHELRHVDQFESSPAFPLLYMWESIRHGYSGNRFEIDARDYAATRLRDSQRSNA